MTNEHAFFSIDEADGTASPRRDVANLDKCLTCHGSDKLIPDSVQARLHQEYPNDRATGYYAGQIRGAVTIKRRLEPGN